MKLDDLLFDCVFQPFAHWFQRMTGKDNFFLALLCSLLATLTLVCVDTLLGDSFGYIIDTVFGMSFTFTTTALQKQYMKENTNKDSLTFNSLRRNPGRKIMRVIWVIFTLNHTLVLIDWVLFNPSAVRICYISLTEVFFVGLLGHFYFLACTPLPPRKSKIGEMARSLGNKLKEALTQPGGLAPAPTPA